MTTIRRQTAYVCTAQQLREGTYVEQEGWNPNYVDLSGKAVCRARITGIIINQTSPFTYIVDDGTGIITARIFEQRILSAGTPVLIIGRPRKEGEELSINTEIIRETSKEWLSHYQQERDYYQEHIQLVKEVRAEKSQNAERNSQTDQSTERGTQLTDSSRRLEPWKQSAERNSQTEHSVQNPSESRAPTTDLNPVQQLINLIKQLDPGDGAPTADVLSQATIPDAEKKLNLLISEGEVFELRAGKIKVLE